MQRNLQAYFQNIGQQTKKPSPSYYLRESKHFYPGPPRHGQCFGGFRINALFKSQISGERGVYGSQT